MKLRILLLSLSPLALAVCPPMLKGLDKSKIPLETDIQEAIDTACGRRNFTTAFWSKDLVQDMIAHMTLNTIKDDRSLCSVVCAKDMETTYNTRAFKPLVVSLRNQFQLMDNAEAKGFIGALVSHHYKYRSADLKRKSTWNRPDEEIKSLNAILSTYVLSNEAEAALSQAIKRCFGFVETPQVRRDRIDVATKALDRIRNTTHANRFIVQGSRLIMELASDDTSFKSFSDRMEDNLSGSGLRPLELVPAIESLYQQHRTLQNEDAKRFVTGFVITRSMAYGRFVGMKDADKHHEIAFTTGVSMYNTLSNEAKTALQTAFPELIAYLKKNGSIKKKYETTTSNVGQIRVRRMQKVVSH